MMHVVLMHTSTGIVRRAGTEFNTGFTRQSQYRNQNVYQTTTNMAGKLLGRHTS